MKLKPSSIKKPNVKLIIGQFDPKKKYVERKEVKLSPKSKISPNKGRKLSAMNRLDGTPPPHKGGDARKSDARLTPKNKLKLGPKIEPKMVIEPNRVKKIISAIEDNINLNVADSTKIEMTRGTAVNAFKLMMEKNGGEISPSPGKRKKKRLIMKDKPHGKTQRSLDGWLKMEK